ncbi:MAG: hypothetical protein MUC38_03085 [Cyclobacteriaceae bacterium]|jgi:hypothetical protein|nr:hypothetical protein [Cyclobacteriaceae bacterium]
MKHLLFAVALLSATAISAQKKGKNLTLAEQAKDNMTVYEVKNPFKKTKRIALLGVDVSFRLATSQTVGKERNSDASSRTWVTLNPPPSAALMQEITNEHYVRLKAKLMAAGFDVVDEKPLQQTEEYKNLISEKERLTINKTWGMAARGSAHEAAMIDFPNFAGGAHARLANRNEVLVWNSNTLLDFVYIDQTKTRPVKGVINMEAAVRPAIIIHSSTLELQGPDYSTFKTSFNADKSISSSQPFHTRVQSCTDCLPEFTERTTGGKILRESIIVLSRGRAGDNPDFKFMFQVEADYAQYKAAALDALDRYADQLIALMR